MATFRKLKQMLERLLLPPAWPEDAVAIPPALEELSGMETVSPLLALLPKGGILKWRAIILLGRVVSQMAGQDMEKARRVMRRCMWHLNEDSGNLGWGVAEAMGEIAAQSAPLADAYGRCILSYVRQTGFADNYIDYAPLRRGAYWAVGRFAPECPAYHAEGEELLILGLADADPGCQGIAAWGIARMAARKGPPGNRDDLDRLVVLLRHVAASRHECEILDGLHVRCRPASAYARQAQCIVAAYQDRCFP